MENARNRFIVIRKDVASSGWKSLDDLIRQMCSSDNQQNPPNFHVSVGNPIKPLWVAGKSHSCWASILLCELWGVKNTWQAAIQVISNKY